MSAEAWASEVRPWGEDWAWLCGDTLRGLGFSVSQPREYGNKPGPARETRQHFGGVTLGEELVHHKSFFVHTLRQQTHTSSGGRCELSLSSWTPEVGTDYCHCLGSHEWAQVTAITSLGEHTACHCCLQGSCNQEPTAATAYLGACVGYAIAHPLSRG